MEVGFHIKRNSSFFCGSIARLALGVSQENAFWHVLISGMFHAILRRAFHYLIFFGHAIRYLPVAINPGKADRNEVVIASRRN